jgi:hypothetical protein
MHWIGIREFLYLWDYVQGFELFEHEDRHISNLEVGGYFSSKSACRAFFMGLLLL